MENATVSTCGPEAETTEAGKGPSRGGRKRIVDYLTMAVLCIVIALMVFTGLDRLFLHSPEAVSGSSPPDVGAAHPYGGALEHVKDRVSKQWEGPGVIEFIEWSPVREVKDSGYSVRARCLARMPSGEYAASSKVFFLDAQGNVINVWNLVM